MLGGDEDRLPPRSENGDHMEGRDCHPHLAVTRCAPLHDGTVSEGASGESRLLLLLTVIPWRRGGHAGSSNEAFLPLLGREVLVGAQ